MDLDAFVVDAELTLGPDTDPRAAGGAITVELCGSWEHAGACRWPHNTRIDTDVLPAHLRTVVVVREGERDDIAGRIESALRRDQRWSVVRCATGAIGDDERPLAERLAGGPKPS